MATQFEDTPNAVIVTFGTTKICGEIQVQEIGKKMIDACEHAAAKGKGLVVDFRGVEFMSSAMIGKLVLLNRCAKNNGVTWQMANVGENIRKMFGPGFSGSRVTRPRTPPSDGGHADPRGS